MIADQIRDVMDEIEKAWESLDEDSLEWSLLHTAHSELGNAHSLVFEVNRLRLKELMDGHV